MATEMGARHGARRADVVWGSGWRKFAASRGCRRNTQKLRNCKCCFAQQSLLSAVTEWHDSRRVLNHVPVGDRARVGAGWRLLGMKQRTCPEHER